MYKIKKVYECTEQDALEALEKELKGMPKECFIGGPAVKKTEIHLVEMRYIAFQAYDDEEDDEET